MVSNIDAALFPLAGHQQAQRHVQEWAASRPRPSTCPRLGRNCVYSVSASGGPRVQAARAKLAKNLPALFPDAPADLLQHIHALWAMQLADSSVESATKTFSKFVSFCLQYGLTALPASQKTMALYVGSLSMEGQVKAEYFHWYLSAVRTVHMPLCFEVPAPDAICNALCTAAARCQRGGRHEVVKLPLPPRLVVGSLRQAAACHNLFDLRLHLLVCLKFLTGVRGASLLGLRRQDVSFVGDMLQVTWRSEKQRCKSAAGRVVQLPLPRCTLFLHVFQRYLAQLPNLAADKCAAAG